MTPLAETSPHKSLFFELLTRELVLMKCVYNEEIGTSHSSKKNHNKDGSLFVFFAGPFRCQPNNKSTIMPPNSSSMRSSSPNMDMTPPVRNVTVIHCWTAPRSRSTALLYSFESRSDTIAVDEPLHCIFVTQRPKMTRSYRQNLLDGIPPQEAEESDHYKWPRQIVPFTDRLKDAIGKLKDQPDGVVFCKHLSKQGCMYNREKIESLTVMHDLDSTVRITHRHALLLRDPVAILSSWDDIGDIHGSDACVEQVGIVPMLTIYESLQQSSTSVAFVDSDELVVNPESVLARLCQDVGIPFTTEMLSWKSGPHECDGPWAPWWYRSLHKSTGWAVKDSSPATPESQVRSVPPTYLDTLQISMPAYTFLKEVMKDRASRCQGDLYKENVENTTESKVWGDDKQASVRCLN
jgi:hypothetical protein